MTAPSAPAGLMTLSDVAQLAHVRRPVVSVWRRRFTGTDFPFPDPVDRREGREVFRLEDVVAWLEESGHGNNPMLREEAAAGVALDVLPPEDRRVAVDGLVALFALRTLLGMPLGRVPASDLLDLADDADPLDRCLYREIAALGPEVQPWARHADALASAAFTSTAAVGSLLGRHRRLGLTQVSDHALAPVVTELVARLTVELDTADLGPPAPLVAPYGDGELLAALTSRGEQIRSAVLPAREDAILRHVRRALVATGWDVTDATEADGAVIPPPGAVVLAQLPSATRPGLTDIQVVDALGEIEATLPADGHAVVLGSARPLCGRLPRPLQAMRATVLRSGRVRAVVRLPAGLWPARPRESLGLWVLGPRRDEVVSAQHRTAVADLRAVDLDPAAVDDLLTDLVAAVGTVGGGGHSFRFARFVTTSGLVASSGELAAPHPVRRRPRTDPASTSLHIADLYARAIGPLPALVPWQVHPEEAAGPALVTLGRLLELGHLRVQPGTRLDEQDLVQGAAVHVHTPATLTATSPDTLTIDRLRLSVDYPRSRYTQAGDVVFCTAPRPGAVVDHDGVSVVAAPARVIRLSPAAPAGLLPEVVAQTIRTAPPTGGWRLWPVPLVPADRVEAVQSALRDIATVRAATADRLAALDELSAHLVDALSTGSVSLTAPPSTTQMEG